MRLGSLGPRGPWRGWLVLGLLGIGLVLAGCSGDDGAPGAPGSSTGTLMGTVTNAANNNAPVAGATIALDPDVGANLTTDAGGNYTVELPVGFYTLACSATNFTAATATASITADGTATLDFALQPTAPVIITITGAPSGPAPGAVFGLTANVTVMDGSGAPSFNWTQTASAAATIANGNTATPTITLGGMAAYKDELLMHATVLDRWGVMGIAPLAAEEAAHVAFRVAVTTDSGTYTKSVDVNADLPFVTWTTGLRAVPVGLPVIMNGRAQESYNWSLSGPSGVTLNDADTANPWFVPTSTGTYKLSVYDEDDEGTVSIDVIAGTWEGVITGVDNEGLPLADDCTGCHNPSTDIGKKFLDWRATGHAHIFSTQINTSDHYSSGCFACHTVGFDTTVDNGGIDDADGYDDFYATMWPGGHGHADPDNWDTVVENWPDVAQLANIQCENCHGPQNGSHTRGEARIDLGANVCGYCHGEPPRHGRFQQWEESAHGNYVTAVEEGASGSCARCHSAQGFLNEWDDADYDLDENTVHPITCVVCHDPHNVGTMSGAGNDAEMREVDLSQRIGDIGFMIPTGGKGTICMSCHNARRGAQNDMTGLSAPDRAPHLGTQTDVLFTQNAFFVDVGLPGKHAFLKDTCVTCHVELTPPPPELSYNLGGTNHSFEASTSICADCHGEFDPEGLEEAVEDGLHHLADLLGEALYDEINAITDRGLDVEIDGYTTEDEAAETSFTITDEDNVNAVVFSESHGRQAMNIQVNGTWIWHVRLNGDTNITDGEVSYGSLVDNDIFPWIVMREPVFNVWPNDPNPDVMPPSAMLGQLGWNYLLLHADGSHGLHNPSFYSEILYNSIMVAEMLDWAIPQ